LSTNHGVFRHSIQQNKKMGNAESGPGGGVNSTSMPSQGELADAFGDFILHIYASYIFLTVYIFVLSPFVPLLNQSHFIPRITHRAQICSTARVEEQLQWQR
jgi:hypothetical protein